MAKEILLKHPSGLIKKAYVGFSWTSLFFGALPAAFRGDWKAFFLYFGVSIILGLFTVGIGSIIFAIVWCFVYNNWQARRLIEQGYVFEYAGPDLDYIKSALKIV